MGRKLLFTAFLIFGSFIIYPPVIAESPKEMTYIALGDSLTAGLGSSEENYLRIHAFVPQFTKYLRKENTVKVVNYGIPGLTSTGLLALLSGDEGLRNRLKTADIISISIGGNNFLQTVRSVPDPEESQLDLNMQILERSLKENYELIREINPKATVMLVGLYNPYPSDHPLHKLGEEYAPKFNSSVKKLSSGSTLFIDPYEAFVNREVALTHIEEDDIHPNDQGYQEIVALMQKAYEKAQ
ncbi:GDSL-type esterase/lipase family protein [Bacillus tianshenii]|uniref:GDSL-type esterase/lipase family protein n=1 Tax=Sutcliffiella tianshenii TaxID=1463404 RepID=UPI001CD815C2|nr:GDSL-type esterase/lipase family protein [Bacillus tianshenii]MCA1320072.1 GDSL-type esterase/lipase family protein [Bacillus tianshenii]